MALSTKLSKGKKPVPAYDDYLNSLDTKNPYPYAMQVTENNGSTSFSFIL
jgi:hypothetical protein